MPKMSFRRFDRHSPLVPPAKPGAPRCFRAGYTGLAIIPSTLQMKISSAAAVYS